MAGTYSQLLLHIVFATKHRECWVDGSLAERLYPYMGGIIRAEGGVAYNIGGVEDHVHLLIRWKPDGKLSDLMRIVKSRSSRLVHETRKGLAEFAWQEGYSAFSVSYSNRDAVDRYIANQAEHHKTMDYRSELLRLLMAHSIDFEERYICD
ncbi:MAG: IS200/IS605 family transposase [Phycisphaerales bacterium]|nr:IS200/IS605 family transposase [Phycisphaerales bacterium]MCB9857067.1 IS200/IS605 family transposase [Phycisphaerales bacterium]MCB9861806.1 IS200/IS605 family transposase [Phycisphaerales bacterium]